MRPLSRSWDKAGRTGKAVFSNDPDNSLQIGKYKMQSRPRLHHPSDRVFLRVLPRSEFSLPPHYPRSRPTRSFGNLSVTLSRTCLRIRLSIWARLERRFAIPLFASWKTVTGRGKRLRLAGQTSSRRANSRAENIYIGAILREQRGKADVWCSMVTRGDNVDLCRILCLLKKSKVCENSLIRCQRD